MLEASMQKNDKKANWIIGIFSVVVFAIIAALGKVKMEFPIQGFDVSNFAFCSALLNSMVAVLLLIALWAVKAKKYLLHKKLMFGALILSILFLVCYICSHLFMPEARFGDSNHDGILQPEEAAAVGSIRYVYYVILATHIVLAAVILPLVLFTAYRALTAQWGLHVKKAKYTWPLWMYVAVTGPIVYWMIHPYYA